MVEYESVSLENDPDENEDGEEDDNYFYLKICKKKSVNLKFSFIFTLDAGL